MFRRSFEDLGQGFGTDRNHVDEQLHKAHGVVSTVLNAFLQVSHLEQDARFWEERKVNAAENIRCDFLCQAEVRQVRQRDAVTIGSSWRVHMQISE